MSEPWLFSTIGRRGYIAAYFRTANGDVRIIGTGNDPFTPGFADCDEAAVLPAIGDDTYKSAVADLIVRHDIGNVLTFSDPDALALAAMRAELTERGVNCFFPDQPVADLFSDKYATAEWATAAGLGAPTTWLNADEITAPGDIVVKPRYGSASIGFGVASSRTQAVEMARHIDDPVFQEFVAGDQYNIEICSDLRGRPVRCVVWKKITSRLGETELAKTVRDPALLDFGWTLASKVELIGPNDADVVVNADGIHLLEINTRFGAGYPVSHLAGAGFPEALIALSHGQEVDPSDDYEADVWMMKRLVPIGGRSADLAKLLRLDGVILDT